MQTSTHISFWLVPTASHRELLATIIRRLAKEHCSQTFEPHVTVYTGRVNIPEATATAEAVSREAKRVCLNVEGVACGDTVSKTLFVAFGPSDTLHELCERIRGKLTTQSVYVLEPHLSLLYHDTLDRKTKENLVAQIRVPLRTICFNELWVVMTSGGMRAPQDVLSWQYLFRKPLGL